MQQPTESFGLASEKLALVIGICAAEIGANLFFKNIKFSSVQNTFDDGVAIIPYLFRNIMVLGHCSRSHQIVERIPRTETVVNGDMRSDKAEH